tara:strand:+ start:14264 stop:14545 length:282 start_codon:yes stop_codon:yes gene_type:complete
MKFIKDYFENRKRKKIQNQIATLLEKGYQLQRNGKLREYAELMKQVEELEMHFVVDEDTDKDTNTDVKNVDNSNFIDYDGMGNQGRFPTTENK